MILIFVFKIIISFAACNFQLDNGNYFDLSPLQKIAANTPFRSKDGLYSLGMCPNTPAKECSESWEKHPFVTQFTTGRQADCISVLAFWDDKLKPDVSPLPRDRFPNHEGFTLEFSNGDWCDTVEMSRKVIIQFLCADEEYQPFEFTEAQSCIYEANFYTKYACVGVAKGHHAMVHNHEVYEHEDSGLSWGWVTMILCLIAITLYCVLGMWYNTQHSEKEGTDVIPNFLFWTAFPRYVLIGCSVSYDYASELGLVGCCSKHLTCACCCKKKELEEGLADEYREESVKI